MLLRGAQTLPFRVNLDCTNENSRTDASSKCFSIDARQKASTAGDSRALIREAASLDRFQDPSRRADLVLISRRNQLVPLLLMAL